MAERRAWVYLNIDNPLTAWATYRSVMEPPPNEGFKSLWTVRHLIGYTDPAIVREMYLEGCRRERFPEAVSRMKGFYCFKKREDADRARSWPGKNFREENLSEILIQGGARLSTHDSNWITYAKVGEDGLYASSEWFEKYWSGNQFPGETPIWETLVDGKASIINLEIRERAYQKAKYMFPNSVVLLEHARIAAGMGSDGGAIHGYLQEAGPDHCILSFYINNDLPKIEAWDASTHVEDLRPFLDGDRPIRTPDLTRFDTQIPKKDAFYLKKLDEG